MKYYFNGCLLTTHNYSPSAMHAPPPTFCRITKVIDRSDADGKIYHYKPGVFSSVHAALEAAFGSDDRIVKIRLRGRALRGGGGCTPPPDAELIMASGKKVSTSPEIAKRLIPDRVEPKEERWVPCSYGAGYEFEVFDLTTPRCA